MYYFNFPFSYCDSQSASRQCQSLTVVYWRLKQKTASTVNSVPSKSSWTEVKLQPTVTVFVNGSTQLITHIDIDVFDITEIKYFVMDSGEFIKDFEYPFEYPDDNITLVADLQGYIKTGDQSWSISDYIVTLFCLTQTGWDLRNSNIF